MFKKIIILLFLVSSLTYGKSYEKNDNNLKVGEVFYQEYTMEQLNNWKTAILEQYEKDISNITKERDEQLVEINILINEAIKLGIQ